MFKSYFGTVLPLPMFMLIPFWWVNPVNNWNGIWIHAWKRICISNEAPIALFGSVSVLAPVVSHAFYPTPIIYAIGASAITISIFIKPLSWFLLAYHPAYFWIYTGVRQLPEVVSRIGCAMEFARLLTLPLLLSPLMPLLLSKMLLP